jgi:hypothetical protein
VLGHRQEQKTARRRNVLETKKEKLARVFNLWARWSYSTKLHELRQPPPLSSMFLGGLNRHDQSKVTDGLPPVEKSPTSSTLEFLCRLGSAWNSRVRRFLTSRRLDAWTNVRPLITVSTAVAEAAAAVPEEAPLASGGLELEAAGAAVPLLAPVAADVPAVVPAVAPTVAAFVAFAEFAAIADVGVCRMTKVKVNVSSSSLGSLRRNEGPDVAEASVSCGAELARKKGGYEQNTEEMEETDLHKVEGCTVA